jgi:hypothetical protein
MTQMSMTIRGPLKNRDHELSAVKGRQAVSREGPSSRHVIRHSQHARPVDIF